MAEPSLIPYIAASVVAGVSLGVLLARAAIHLGRRLERAEQEAKAIAITVSLEATPLQSARAQAIAKKANAFPEAGAEAIFPARRTPL